MTYQLTSFDIIKTYSESMSKRLTRENPYLIGSVAGVEFYEHPIQGDESPLIAKQNDLWVLTSFYELPWFDVQHGELCA